MKLLISQAIVANSSKNNVRVEFVFELKFNDLKKEIHMVDFAF